MLFRGIITELLSLMNDQVQAFSAQQVNNGKTNQGNEQLGHLVTRENLKCMWNEFLICQLVVQYSQRQSQAKVKENLGWATEETFNFQSRAFPTHLQVEPEGKS